MKIRRGIKLRLYPTDELKQFIRQSEGNKRFVWNTLREHLNDLYEANKNNPDYKFPSKFDIVKMVKVLKENHPYLYLSESSSLQQVAESLYDAYVSFFKGTRKRPKRKYRSYKGSFTMKRNGDNIRKLSPSYLKLPKFKDPVKVSNQPIIGDIKRVTVSFTSSGQYYVSVLVESESQAITKTGDCIGIDIGLTSFITLSNGIKESMPKYHKELENKRIYWERRCARRLILAKQRLGDDFRDAKNYQKAREMVAKLRQKEANQRKDFLQKLSTYLVRAYDVIVIEDIKSSNLMKNHKLAESIMRFSWRMFREMLAYKCEQYGKQLIVVDPAYTTQECSSCGCNNGKQPLSVRQWQCNNCDIFHDRDINAAINILNKGLVAV